MKSAGILSAVLVAVSATSFGITIDGSISGGEGWLHLTEIPNASPVLGGSATHSDNIGESSSFFWSDGTNPFTFNDNRADVMDFYIAHDVNNLYLAVAGPTALFNSFNDGGAGFDQFLDNDQGDLYIAIDAAGGSPSGSLSAGGGHTNFGIKAVDFMSWQPTQVLGVEYVDNGGGGGGYADLQTTGSHADQAGEGQNQNNGGFDWHGAVNGAAAYDSFNGNAGEFEFQIPWSMLGLPSGGPAAGEPMRFAIYVTQNLASYDAYDSGPGFANGTAHEQIGDNPGDPDSGGQLGPTDPGSTLSPGSNPIGDLSLSASHDDGVDTIEEHYSFVVNAVPEPGTLAMMGLGLLAIVVSRRSRIT